jgi:CPA2 family monovalent cation:H+ antiporter-2
MSEIINLFTLMFVTASVILLVLNRFSSATIPGFIVAGIALNNYIPEEEMVLLSQIGIAFLVFIFGLKTDIDRLQSVAKESLTTAIIQVSVLGLTAYLVAQGFGLNNLNSLYVAAAAGFSSTLVGLELIESEVRTDILHGRLAESIQLMHDLMALVVIAVLSAEINSVGVLTSLGQLMVIITLALIFRKLAFQRIADTVEGSRELLMLVSLSILTGFIGLTEVLNSSLIIGSFAAGLAISKFPENMEILDTTGSLKDFFSAIFFIALGSLVAFPSFETVILTLFLVTSTLFLVPLVAAITLMASGYDKRTSYLTGLSLDQISEFALIIAIQAYVAGSIEPFVFQSIVLSATLTMIVSSYTSRYQEKIYRLNARISPIEVSSKKIKDKTNLPENLYEHVILLGYDTQGKEIVEALKEENQDFVIIENDPEKIIEISKQEDYYIYGDVLDPESWNKARYKEAKLIVSTIPFEEVSDKVLNLDTDADKILRAQEIKEAKEYLEKGALYVNVPDILSSRELIEHLEGVVEKRQYREELRRRNLLEIRSHFQEQDD